jgi:metal-sulfur cluster biosynthetic enzyme
MQVHCPNADVDAVLEALRHVVEPHLGVNIVDLGLVYAVHVADETLHVELGVLMPQHAESAELEACVHRTLWKRLPQYRRLELSVRHDRVWHPGRISDQARQWLGL